MDWLLPIIDPASIKTVIVQFESEMQQPAFGLAVGKIIRNNT